MENICYLLFLDIVEWFSKPCTSQMRYINENTLNFWRVGYRLFYRKFIRFMNGPKSTGQVLTGQTEQGHYLARESEINSAVPSVSVFNKDLSQPMLPGFFLKSINELASYFGKRPIKIGVDGKKIAQGKGKNMGDIDCWGFETPPTLEDRKLRLQNELE